MKPYQPSNKVTGSGFQWLLLSSLIGGATIGGLTYLISRLVYLVVLFPLAMGFAGGFTMTVATRGGKVRNPKIAALFGLLTGVVLYGTMHYAGYWQFQQAATQEITKELGQANRTKTQQIINSFLREETNHTGFIGYLKYSAKQGVSIGRIGQQGGNLGETGTWIYWLIEFAIVNGMITWTAWSTAKDPFCENCDEWYRDKEQTGNVNSQYSQDFINLLKNEQYSRAGELLYPAQTVYTPSLTVQVQRCPKCQIADLMLIASEASQDNKGNLQLHEMSRSMISLSEYNKLMQAATKNLPQEQTSSDPSLEVES